METDYRPHNNISSAGRRNNSNNVPRAYEENPRRVRDLSVKQSQMIARQQQRGLHVQEVNLISAANAGGFR